MMYLWCRLERLERLESSFGARLQESVGQFLLLEIAKAAFDDNRFRLFDLWRQGSPWIAMAKNRHTTL